MDYETGIRLDAINEKLDYLITELQKAEDKAKKKPKEGK